jgi:Derlin-2/3
MRMSFLGLITFNAPYLPWTLLGFSILIHGVIPYADMLGFVVGHMYYYLEDVYPTMAGGRRILAPPSWFLNLVQGQPAVQVNPIPDLQMDNLVGR